MSFSDKKSAVETVFLNSWHPYLWFTIITFLLYLQVLTFTEFTYYDDHFLIVESFSYIDELTDAGHAFIEDVSHQNQGGNLYRPMLTLSLILSAQISGTGLFGYHLIDIILHIAGCGLLFKVLQMLGFNRILSFCAVLIFCVHPALTQSVAWIAGRNDSLLAVFILLCLITFIKYFSTSSLKWYFLHLLFFTLALFTKETGLAFPIIAVLYIYFFYKNKIFSITSLLFLAGWGIILINWHILRSAALITPIGDKFQAIVLILLNMPIAIYYLGLIFWPVNPAFAPIPADIPITAGVISAVLLIFLLILSKRRDWKIIIFGGLWFIAFLIPTFYYDPRCSTMPEFYEHRIYIPFMGILFILLSLSFTYLENIIKKIIPYVIVLLICGLGFISFIHTKNFRNSLTLGEYHTLTSPGNPKLYNSITQMIMPEKLKTEIQVVTDTSKLSSRQFSLSKEELGLIIKNREKELESNPYNPNLHHALAIAQFANGLFLSSEKNFNAAIKNNGNDADIYYNLGILYYNAKNIPKAREAWTKTLKIDSSMSKAQLNLSYLFYETGYYDLAWLHCQKAEQSGIKVFPEFINEIREKLQ